MANMTRLESDEECQKQDIPPVVLIYRILAKCAVTSQQEEMEMLGARYFAFIHGVLTWYPDTKTSCTPTCWKKW